MDRPLLRLARVGVVAVENGGHVHVDDIPVLEDPFSRNPMTNLFIDGDADALGVSAVMKGSRSGSLFDGEFMHQGVDLFGFHPHPKIFLDQIEKIEGQTACPLDGLYIRPSFEPDPVIPEIPLLDVIFVGKVLAETAFLVFEPAAAGAGIVSPRSFLFHSKHHGDDVPSFWSSEFV